ncbi:hypothetical protein DAPPUDRAFT_103751 [Daphnia pulex]|uniref:Uncharacterized protein n=1 Tax=Daphnia pulex TaxID=6669 RepID=E9GK26_DAPPU|nr:hypothetical protein DAPPUDRAFT_103751 [Daphnia pulex]|eukprot:EFX80222.1 hypothetical protein DAPPUDRAFT_103751 [Daphnia pulex]
MDQTFPVCRLKFEQAVDSVVKRTHDEVITSSGPAGSIPKLTLAPGLLHVAIKCFWMSTSATSGIYGSGTKVRTDGAHDQCTGEAKTMMILILRAEAQPPSFILKV